MNSLTTAVAEPVWSHHVLDHQLTADYRLFASDLWPPLQLASATTTTTTSTMAVAPNLAFRGHEIASCKDGVSAAACGITFVHIKVTPGGQSEITTLKARPANVDKYTPRLTTIVPMCRYVGHTFLPVLFSLSFISNMSPLPLPPPLSLSLLLRTYGTQHVGLLR